MTDLSVILSAEHYDDGVFLQATPRPRDRDASSRRESASRSAVMTSPTSPVAAMADDALLQQQQKRAPPEAVEEQEHEPGGGKKRARGRPRVEPKDDTAADRRRTQIRLAQRAYRNRKETAIQTLEKKVTSLQDSNEEMSRAFMALYDTAVAQGLLASAPDFGRQLQATTEKFVALARRGSEDEQGNAESVDGGGSIGSNERTLSESPESAWHAQPASSSDAAGRRTSSTSPDHGRWEQQRSPRASFSRGEHVVPLSAPFDYRIASGHADAIALRPSVDAGLPFGTSVGGAPGSIPASTLSSTTAPPLSRPLSLVVPPSYSYLERTFGRRLQRSALEQGLALLYHPSPPPGVLAGVFGFCLLFESRVSIVERITDTLSRTRQTLHNWRQPFFHLGGAGSFFGPVSHTGDSSDDTTTTGTISTPSDGEPLLGNQGTEGPHKPARDVDFAMGPFTEEVENVRSGRVDMRMRMLVPGFEGDFFDPDEVEFWLRRRGVYIPPASDFVTVEIDPDEFVTGGPGGDVLGMDLGASCAPGIVDGDTSMADPVSLYVDPDADPFAAFGTGDLPSLDAIDINFSSYVDFSAAQSKRRKVTINVAVFVEEMTMRAVCLGRSPGVRPKDIVASFWAACEGE